MSIQLAEPHLPDTDLPEETSEIDSGDYYEGNQDSE